MIPPTKLEKLENDLLALYEDLTVFNKHHPAGTSDLDGFNRNVTNRAKEIVAYCENLEATHKEMAF